MEEASELVTVIQEKESSAECCPARPEPESPLVLRSQCSLKSGIVSHLVDNAVHGAFRKTLECLWTSKYSSAGTSPLDRIFANLILIQLTASRWICHGCSATIWMGGSVDQDRFCDRAWLHHCRD